MLVVMTLTQHAAWTGVLDGAEPDGIGPLTHRAVPLESAPSLRSSAVAAM
jgi:hypothetical protein